MRYTMLALLLPVMLSAQDLVFQQEFDTIPVEINGWQTFAPFGGGESESYPEFCDLDDDGDLDLFVGNYNGFVSYYKNEGNNQTPSFDLITRAFNDINLLPMPFQGHVAPRLCDLDGDLDMDLYVGDHEGLIHHWENLGTPSLPQFQWSTDSFEYINVIGLSRFDFIDIERDGDFDLFIGNYYGKILFYRNVGTAAVWDFALVTDQFASIDVGFDASPVFVDLDSDRDFDLFVGNCDGRVWYYRNDGDSVNYDFTYVTNNYNNIWVDWRAAPEFGDIDADGDYDLLVGRDNFTSPNSPGDVFYYENVGTPFNAQWNLITQNFLSLDQGEISQNHHTDIDADGDYDLFSSNFNDRISYYRNSGTPDSAAFRWITDSYQNLTVNDPTIHFCDIDADADVDLFMGEGILPNPPYPGLYYYQNRGTPQAAAFTLSNNNLVPNTYFVKVFETLADIDGDNDQDLFITDAQDVRYYYENYGTPTTIGFGAPTYSWFGAFPDYALHAFCFYDIDNDGDLDLFGAPAAYNVYNWIWFYRNQGTPQNPLWVLETQNLLNFERQERFSGIDIFDIDADGDGDIILSLTNDGGMYFFRNVTGQSPVDPRKRLVPTYPTIDLNLQPNPGNPLTTITLALPNPQKITLAVYNLMGAKITTLANGMQPAGQRTFLWDNSQRSSGVYLIKLETPTYSATEKVVIVK